MRISIREIFDTEEDAEEFKENYYQSYSPFGYSTSLSIRKDEDGQWVVHGYRYSSCD